MSASLAKEQHGGGRRCVITSRSSLRLHSRTCWRHSLQAPIRFSCQALCWQGAFQRTVSTPLRMQGGPGSVRLRFGGGTVRYVLVFGSGGCSVFQQKLTQGRFRFRFQFLKNGSSGSSSAFGSWENGSDSSGNESGFRFRFGSWATLKHGFKNGCFSIS